MKKADQAAQLRAVAADLDAEANDAPRSVGDVLKRFGVEVHNVDVSAELRALGSSSYDARSHLRHQAATLLARHVADGMEFEYRSQDRLIPPWDMSYAQCTFRARVHVLSPELLKKIVEAAYQAGRSR